MRSEPRRLLSILFSWIRAKGRWSLAGAAISVFACKPCGGDRVLVDGACVPRCSDDTCASGLVCVHSTCRPTCDRDSDCKGEDICEKTFSDEGKSGKYCYGSAIDPSPYVTGSTEEPSAPDTTMEPTSRACSDSSDCDQTVQRHCVDERCETACTLHEHCGRAGACVGSGTSSENQSVTYCAPDSFPRAEGQYGSTCLTGASNCDTTNGFQCVRAGDGDLGSYCTRAGCTDEADCPSGYFCSENRVASRLPCEDACGIRGDSAADDCVPLTSIGAGKPFRCADAGGLLLTVCLERSFCAPCETDSDCRAEPNQVCAKGPDGVKSCTVLCAPNQGSCPWGGATECATFDQDLGQPTCGHRFGACKGTGQSCHPCVHDGDCPTGFCAKSDFSGERFCYDSEASCSCTDGEEICVGGGCPLTPSGKAMNCVSTGDSEPPSACYGAEIDETAGAPLGCW